MPLFPDIDLIGQPEYKEALRQLSPNAVTGVDMLVIYDTDLDFLTRVLNAAGFDEPKLQLHLLQWSPAEGGVDLTGLIRHLNIKRVSNAETIINRAWCCAPIFMKLKRTCAAKDHLFQCFWHRCIAFTGKS